MKINISESGINEIFANKNTLYLGLWSCIIDEETTQHTIRSQESGDYTLYKGLRRERHNTTIIE